MPKGQFIVFEGLDGSGQSTQADLLAKKLEQEGVKVLLTREPTNNLIGGILRGALTGVWKPSATVLQLLYAADRGHHLDREIIPALNDGYTVITERYFYSSIAYGSLELDTAWLEAINKNYRAPDMAFYINVSPKVALARIYANRYGTELFEKEQTLIKVAETYDLLTKTNPLFAIINGEGDIAEIEAGIYKLYQNKVFASE